MNTSASGAASTLLVASVALGGVALGAAGGWFWRESAAAQRPPAVTTHGEWVKFARGTDSIRAYVAYPERKDPGPAVIVIHEVFGLTDWEPTVADRLAANGYVAILPDLLSSKFGQTPTGADSGRKLIAQLEPERIMADLDATYSYLQSLKSVQKDRIGTIGFCWGGARSFLYATHNPALRAAVVCYGSAPDSANLASINASVLGVYGEEDARINAALPQVEASMKGFKKEFSYKLYPGTGHGFLKPGRKGSDTPAVETAWRDIFTFYGRTLGK